MFERLDQTRSLTANQMRILAAAILGDMLEFFDYFLIGFVLAFIVGPWKLSFGQSAIILLSSGIGAILGAAVWGRLADRIGRRAVFIGTVLNFSIATGILALTPDQGWIFLTIFRFFVGFGVGGLYCVDLPLVQEFVPASRRGFIGGLVTSFIPLGVMIGSVLGAFLTPVIGWRGLFACGLVPALLALLIRACGPGIAALSSADAPARRSAPLARLGAQGAPGIVAIAANSRGGDKEDAVERSVPVSAQPPGLLAHQSGDADDRLRRHSLGADLVCYAAWRVSGGGEQPHVHADAGVPRRSRAARPRGPLPARRPA